MPEKTAGKSQDSNSYNDYQRRKDKNIACFKSLRQDYTANQRKKKNKIGTIKGI